MSDTSLPPARTGLVGDLAQPILAGILAALVGFSSTFTLVLAGPAHLGASPAEAASGLFALCLAMGLLNAAVAWRMRVPLSFAWSTPGAAFLLTLQPIEGGFPAVTGAFIIVALLVIACGLLRPLAKAVAAIPQPIAAAMLAGVLLTLCLAPVKAVAEVPVLALPIIAAWVIGLRFARRYAVPLAVVVAAIVLALSASIPEGAVAFSWPTLSFVAPLFTLDALVKVALPLFVITMASQNLTGLAVMRANGYAVDAGLPFVLTGLASGVIALFGGLTVNLAAITAAIAAGPEAHPDPAKRWVAPVAAGMSYFGLALLATLAAAFIAASPPVLIQAVAGLALLPSLAGALTGALADEEARLPAIVTFVTTASGITLLGIGGAFWGLLAGIALQLVLRRWSKA
ncbi:MAG: benzoate transporter BenE [Hyphomicrobiales bacterium]|nr:MAG: benzoate transporter BenE [Hyphomicrobiales bacterium]